MVKVEKTMRLRVKIFYWECVVENEFKRRISLEESVPNRLNFQCCLFQ